MKYPWETWNLVPNQLAAGTLSTLRWEPCLHQRRLSWLCNRKFLKGNCMMIIMVILEFFCKYRWKQTFGSHSSGTEAVGNKSDGGRSTECWSGFVSAYGLRISTSLGFDLPSFSVWPLQSSRCAIESRNKSLVKSVDPMAPKPIPISSIVPLHWSGWVCGPWDLRISPNFYSCFQ